MQYGVNATSAETEPRPQTDLEILCDNLKGAGSFGQELNAILSQIVIKLRGCLPPEPGTKVAQLAAVPSGILGELREAQDVIKNNQGAALELIQAIRAAI